MYVMRRKPGFWLVYRVSVLAYILAYCCYLCGRKLRYQECLHSSHGLLHTLAVGFHPISRNHSYDRLMSVSSSFIIVSNSITLSRFSSYSCGEIVSDDLTQQQEASIWVIQLVLNR
jgi:hypothetical protein